MVTLTRGAESFIELLLLFLHPFLNQANTKSAGQAFVLVTTGGNLLLRDLYSVAARVCAHANNSAKNVFRI